MAQVNSEAGVSQVPPTIVVPNKVIAPGASDARGKATLTTVAYGQSEPGLVINPKRS